MGEMCRCHAVRVMAATLPGHNALCAAHCLTSYALCSVSTATWHM